MPQSSMRMAIVGCGYVAGYYGKTFGNYPHLVLGGCVDLDFGRAQAFASRFGGRAYVDLNELLADDSIGLVLNLTNPRAHFEITERCLEAGKHVYSEKPLAMEFGQAARLVRLAAKQSLYLGCAPCSLLSESARTLFKAVRDGKIGKVRLVYANFDDGMIAPQMQPWTWRNEEGVCWPAKDEFEVGCTYEHAGYVLTWLAAMFGPARAVTSFASCQIPDKGISVDQVAPDFSVGCIEYDDNVVARVTCSLVAPLDKSITVIGDQGLLMVRNVRQDAGPVWLRRLPEFGWRARIMNRVNRGQRILDAWLPALPWRGKQWQWTRQLPLVEKPKGGFVGAGKPVDFCRGPAEMASAIAERRPCRLSAELGMHIVEIVEALQYPQGCGRRKLNSDFAPISFP